MNRAHVMVAATLLGASLAIGAAAQQTAPPPMTSVLAGKKFTPPFKGQAEVDFTKPKTTQSKDHKMVITTIEVKNNMNAPLLRLTIDETWYDDKGGLVTGSKGVISRLEPGEVGTIKIETPFDPKMKANNYNFTHANGTVKPHRVDKMAAAGDAAKEPAAKPAAKKK
jgi:hypothetical protein